MRRIAPTITIERKNKLRIIQLAVLYNFIQNLKYQNLPFLLMAMNVKMKNNANEMMASGG